MGYTQLIAQSVVLVDGSERGGHNIAAVNGVWMEQSLPCNPDWEDLFQNFFKASFAQVDFRNKGEEVRLEVHTWASRHTSDIIKDVWRYIYGNASYFKGGLEKEFDKSMTRDNPLHFLNGKTVSLPFMRSHRDQFIEASDDFKVPRLPYLQGCNDTIGKFSMYIYLPNKKGELDNLLDRMTSTAGFLERSYSEIPS